MSQHLRSSSPIQTLSIGDIVTAAFRLYGAHFKQYLGISFTGVLWSVIPIYGWAKFHTLNATISRLAFGELISKPESVNTVRSHLNSRMWSFLVTQILVSVILFLTNICLSIPQAIVTGIIGILLINNLPVNNSVSIILNPLIFAAYTWVYSRFFISELPLAIESNVDVKQAVSRSWELTKGYVLRLQGIIIVAFLITLPIICLTLTPFFFAVSFTTFQALNSAPESFSLFLSLVPLGLILFMLATVFVTPFWQAIKAVVYYDLRNRREGLDLKLRKRTT